MRLTQKVDLSTLPTRTLTGLPAGQSFAPQGLITSDSRAGRCLIVRAFVDQRETNSHQAMSAYLSGQPVTVLGFWVSLPESDAYELFVFVRPTLEEGLA